MRLKTSLFFFSLVFLVVNKDIYADVTHDNTFTRCSKCFLTKLAPSLSYEIDLNRVLINLTSIFIASWKIYKNDFFSAGIGIKVKWLDLLVRVIIGKKNYFIPIDFLNIHVITLDFYYVNVYFINIPIYDLIFLAATAGKNKENKENTNDNGYNKRKRICIGLDYFVPLLQLNLNRIISDFFYSEEDII